MAAAPSRPDFAYHLWSVRESAGAPITGMAAFFSLLAPPPDGESPSVYHATTPGQTPGV